jgi:hypothetical protein
VERMKSDDRIPGKMSTTKYDLIVLEHWNLVKVIRLREGSCCALP